MLLTSRNKPIYINPTQIVALSQCTPSETDTLGANCCIHCVGQSFLVKETFEQVYVELVHYLTGVSKSSIKVPWIAEIKTQLKEELNVTTQEGLLRATTPSPILRTRRRSAP